MSSAWVSRAIRDGAYVTRAGVAVPTRVEVGEWCEFSALDDLERRLATALDDVRQLRATFQPVRGTAPVRDTAPDLCPVCNRPAHATESDDLGRHAECVGDDA